MVPLKEKIVFGGYRIYFIGQVNYRFVKLVNRNRGFTV